MTLELSGADLGALQVLEDTEGTSFALRGTTQALDVVRVLFVSAVREVQAGDVHAQFQ